MVLGILKLIGAGLFLYLTWRNLRENYQEEKLISYAWASLLAFMIGGRLVFGLINWGAWNDNWTDWLMFWQKPGFYYPGGVVGILLMTVWECKVNEWKLWSFLEDMTQIIYLLVLFYMANEWVMSGFGLTSGVFGLSAVLGLTVSQLVAKKYRSFGWYKSGKKGFGFFFTNFIVLIILALIAVFLLKSMIFAVIFGILGLISLTGLFILGEVFIN
jgi:prolipoprotein diacylglyceryltransferase